MEVWLHGEGKGTKEESYDLILTKLVCAALSQENHVLGAQEEGAVREKSNQPYINTGCIYDFD